VVTSRRAARAAAWFAIAAIVVAACGGSAASIAPSTPPSAAPTPTASPSPSAAVDLITSVKAQLNDPAYTASFDILGDMKAAAIEFEIGGTYRFKAGDWSSKIILTFSGGTQVEEYVNADGQKYKRTGEGVWFNNDSPNDGLDFGQFTAQLVDEGVETRRGQELHRLTIGDAELDPAFFGITPEEGTDVKGSMEFFASDEGVLEIMAMELSAQILSNGQSVPVDMAMDLVRDATPAAFTIAAPAVSWTSYTSEGLGFTMAYPSAWTLEAPLEDGTELYVSDDSEVSVARYPMEQKTLEEYGKALIVGLELGEPGGQTPVAVGGQPGLALLWADVAINDVPSNLVYVTTVRDKETYDLVWIFPTGDMGDQGDLVDEFLSTFKWS
jgi:hypothetical protein